jgi:hypothetical protein
MERAVISRQQQSGKGSGCGRVGLGHLLVFVKALLTN